MILYHFTSRYHFTRIIDDGFLELGCSDLMVEVTGSVIHAYEALDEPEPCQVATLYDPTPLVVHPAHRYAVPLTDDCSPRRQGWAKGSAVDKTEYRITVDVPDAEVHHWDTWARNLGCDRRFLAAFNRRGHQHWFLIERRVDRSEWVVVEQRTSKGWVEVDLESLPGPSGKSRILPPRFLPALRFACTRDL